MRRCSVSIGSGREVFSLCVYARRRRCQYVTRFVLVYVLKSIPDTVFVQRIVLARTDVEGNLSCEDDHLNRCTNITGTNYM